MPNGPEDLLRDEHRSSQHAASQPERLYPWYQVTRGFLRKAEHELKSKFWPSTASIFRTNPSTFLA